MLREPPIATRSDTPFPCTTLFRSLFGRPLAEGERFVQAELARTLRAIAAGGRDAFYTGEIAEDIVGHLRSKGGLHTLDAFAAQRAEYVEPITTDYRGYLEHEGQPQVRKSVVEGKRV